MDDTDQVDAEEIFCQFVDYLLPELTPLEVSLYLLLLRNSLFENGELQCRIGKRGISEKLGKSSRAKQTAFEKITKMLEGLEDIGAIKIRDLNKDGYLYEIVLPAKIPIVMERLSFEAVADEEEDYFKDPDKRRQIFDRDQWTCQYCSEKVDKGTATVDHFIPQSKGGSNAKENLRTCCFACNSIKSGKSFAEAAPLILESIKKRKQRSE